MIDIYTYIERGGSIVYLLMAMSVIGISIMIWKLLVLSWASLKVENISSSIASELKESSKFEIQHIQALVQLKVKQLESGLNTVKIIASISPLLGLLGTVIGILNSFDNITYQGLGDPTVFSSGISVALITTVAGLVVAIPHYIGYNYLIGTLDSLEIKLEKAVLNSIK